MTKMLHLTTDQIVRVMRAELMRQYDENELNWYTEDGDSVTVDGHPDLKKIAEAIVKEGE